MGQGQVNDEFLAQAAHFAGANAHAPFVQFFNNLLGLTVAHKQLPADKA
jgi:hypothetical protein